MEHLLAQVRPTIDAYEDLLKNVFGSLPAVQAVWVREVQEVRPCDRSHPHQADADCTGVRPKVFTRAVWVQLSRRSPTAERHIAELARELTIRAVAEPFKLEVRVVTDTLPPDAVAPSCIFRRGSGKV